MKSGTWKENVETQVYNTGVNGEQHNMKISKKQLQKIVKESHSLAISPSRAEEIFDMISEFGFRLYDSMNNILPTWMDSNTIAIDDAMAAYPGEFSDQDVDAAVKFIKDAMWVEDPDQIREGSRDGPAGPYQEVPSIKLQLSSDGVTGEVATLPAATADVLEGLIAQCYDVTDEMLMKLELGEGKIPHYAGFDPRLQKAMKSLEAAMENLYDTQMMFAHLRDGTGS